MLYSDHEWLRFVTFALVAGATLGVAYTTALALAGHTVWFAASAGVVGTGGLAIVAHLALRYVLNAAHEPIDSTDSQTDTDTTDT